MSEKVTSAIYTMLHVYCSVNLWDAGGLHFSDTVGPHLSDTVWPHLRDTVGPHLRDTVGPHLRDTVWPHFWDAGEKDRQWLYISAVSILELL